jgi:hypothetical protein
MKKISTQLNMNFVKLNAMMIGVAGKEFKMKSPHNAGFSLLGAARGQARRILESWQYAQKSLENFV